MSLRRFTSEFARDSSNALAHLRVYIGGLMLREASVTVAVCATLLWAGITLGQLTSWQTCDSSLSTSHPVRWAGYFRAR